MKFEYITDRRGGWDDWSDPYSVVTGLKVDGDWFERRVFDTLFIDTNGNVLEIELPRREQVDTTITVEIYEPEYDFFEVSLSHLEEACEWSPSKEQIIVDIETLEQLNG